MSNHNAHITMEEVTDPQEIAAARQQRERVLRNVEWLHEHAAEIYDAHRGKFICVAGQEVFAGETVQEAFALAKAAHPDDNGAFTRYIPREKMPRIYAL